MKYPKILIIIVTWDKEEYVLNLLESIETLIYEKEHFDILLIDNASTDNTVLRVSKEYPKVKLICNKENLGGTGGFNTGLKWASEQPDGKYDYLWLLDNDVVVNKHALIELVNLLEQNRDAAIAGSSMMQLDYPWRINEIGSYYNKANGSLIFNFHFMPVEKWRGTSMEELLKLPHDLSDFIPDFKPYIDVDYVAAASMLVRADVAKKAGIWNDFFIHFDDVEWCLRIGAMGYRVLASCRSIIWHLSSAAKIPTWVLYYDTRNSLSVMKKHGDKGYLIDKAVNYELKKAFYYALIGRLELANIIVDGVDDFANGITGKRNIKLPAMLNHREQHYSELPFMDIKVKKILIPWTVNMIATGLQEILVRVKLQRPELQIDFMKVSGMPEIIQFPKAHFIVISSKRFIRYINYLKLRDKYDLILQSEYQRIIGLSLIGGKIMFISNTNYCIRNSPKFFELCLLYFRKILTRWKIYGLTGRPKGFFMKIVGLSKSYIFTK
ncbi:MAG: glycosyltransferase family 2 protein [Desulfamplus sp.]|nr:glycosyltransferase family 2 protein [Desulfamplus sp.]